ncbi:MAG: hypothetical protein EA404_15445 [Spirochaetaceae bacterium]|nr:MAG: hypothetical protein EA404_15445 [Spirochaetaceae bacterium]
MIERDQTCHTTTPRRASQPDSAAELRANAYALLSSLYQDQPDRAAVQRFSTLWSSSDTTLAAGGLGQRTVEAGKQFCTAWQTGDGKLALQLRREFALLFLSPLGGVHPFESVYCGTRRRLMDEPWLEVREFYREAGIEKGQQELHPEDHVAVELGFMAYLAFLESHCSTSSAADAALIEATDTQRRFLDEHLIRWVPQLCRRIEAVPAAPYYHRVARFTSALIEEDHARLSMPAEQLHNTWKEGSL